MTSPGGPRPSAREKIRPIEALAGALDALRAQGRTIVHCHGVFDLLHAGHIRYFEQARRRATCWSSP